ncbi:MAG TPA: hypothetical protein VGE07_13940 [Herpetosiphonaceae bacterium]
MAESRLRWEREAIALIRVLGHDELPTAPAAICCQAVFCPTFHPAACLTLALGAEAGELWLSILRGSRADAVARAGRESGGHPGAAPRLEASVELDRAASAELRRRLADCQPAKLGDRLLASRDGISVWCRYADPQLAHTIHMSSPSAAEAPQHMRLLRILLAAAKARIDDAAIQDYLATLDGYFQ